MTTEKLVSIWPPYAREGLSIPSCYLRTPQPPTIRRRTAGGSSLCAETTCIRRSWISKDDEVQGNPELVERGVASDPWYSEAYFSVSRNGVVTWRPGRAALSQVTIFDRSGNITGFAGPPDTYNYLRRSPDGTRLLAEDNKGTRLLEPGRPGVLSLSGDARWTLLVSGRIALVRARRIRQYCRTCRGGWIKPTTTSARQRRQLRKTSRPDGNLVLYRNGDGSISWMRLSGGAEERAPKSVAQTNESIYAPRFSPDGHWIAYSAHSQQNDNLGIYIQPFLPGRACAGKLPPKAVTPVEQEWKGDPLLGLPGQIWAVPLKADVGELRVGAPQALFSVRPRRT